MKKLNFKFKIKIKSRAAIIFAGLFILGIAYYIISREVLFPKLSYSIFDNSYYYNGSDFNIKVKKEEDQIASKFESRGASINTKLLGYTAERYGDKNTLFQGRKMDAQAFYSLSNGVAYIEYRAEKNGMKEFIYLKNSASPRWYDFELNLENISDYKQINGEWIFFNKNGTQVFKIPKGYMVDAKGVYSDDVEILITDRENKKIVSVRPNLEWLNDVNRAYPVAVDPSVVVSDPPSPVITDVVTGGMTTNETQFGSLQRKIVNVGIANFYSFHADGGQILYKKSTDTGATWGSNVTVDSDTDNYNPTTFLKDQYIYVAWIDDGADAIEVNRINTSSSDSLGTKCTTSSLGTIGSSFLVSIAVTDDNTVYVSYSDTGGDTEAGVLKLEYSGCTFTDVTPINETVTAINAGAGDGYIASDTDTYNGACNTGLGLTSNNTSTTFYVGQEEAPSAVRYRCFQLFMPFDTSPIPDTDIVRDVKLSLYGVDDQSAVDFNAYVFQLEWLPLTTADWQDAAALAALSPRLASWSSSSYVSGYNEFVSDKEFADAINKTDVTELFVVSDRQISQTVPPNDTREYIGFASANTSGTSQDPLLTITHGPTMINAGSRPILAVNGNNLHVVTQDGNLTHWVYDGNNWTVEDQTIASVTDDKYSVVSNDDGTLWVLSKSGTTSSNLYYYNGSTWSTQTVPWSSETNLIDLGLTIDTSDNALYAFAVKDSSEQVYYKYASIDPGSISWNSQTSVGFTAGDLSEMTVLNSVISGRQHFGVLVKQGSDLEAATFILGDPTLFQFGGIQRKVAYSEDSSAWYVFYTSSGNIVYKKSSDGSTWGSPVTVASGNKANPSVWMHTDGKIYVTWLDTSANTISANTVDTASSDTLGTACVSSSLGTISDTFTASISVATDDTVYLAYSDTSTDTEAGVYKLTYSGCSFSDITSGSGLTSGDRPVLDAVGTNLHMVYQDGQLSHSVYNGSSWTSSDTQIANVTDNVYSTVSDGSNVWVLSKSGTTGTNFYFYDGTWSTETAPWSGETNVVSVTLSYASDEKALFATIIKDATEQAYWSMQLVDPAPNQVSGWVAGGSYDFTPGNLSELTSVYSTIIAPNIAIALLQESNIEFAFQDEDTLSNYQTIETRLGENTDVFDPPSTENTVFGRLAYISETQSGTSSDDGSDPTLFGRVGSPTDIQQCTETGCANETIFGILKNLPGRSRNMLSQFGGYGTESTSGVCGATGAIYISAGIHQYAGNCTVGDGSTPTAIHPADGTIRGGLFLFFTGNLTITNNAKIDVSGYGAPGGNGGNTNFNGFGGWGGGPDGGNGAAGNVSGTRNGGDAGPNSISGAGGGGGGDFCDGFGTGGAGGGGAGANGGNGSKKTGTSCASCDTVCNGFNNAEETLAAKRDSILTTAKYGVLSSYGAGGGGGAGIATTVVGGGGGGGGGGLIWIRTRNLINNGTLNINGGAAGLRGATSGSIGSGVNGEGGNGALNGSAAGKSSGSDGGGGGGGGAGGGVIYIEANAITINSGGGLHARGGNGGNGGNTPGSPTAASYNGKNGANGFVFIEIVP